MNLQKALRDHWLRIDARSLGLFRLTMGVVLFYDLFRRWRFLKEFYSNDGVLPNHNHLYNLREVGQVWSVLHAFSSVGESQAGFCVILFFYLCFFVGYSTRVFHVLALVCLVSLGSRNILLENAGNYIAVALLAFTAFLPLGSRFSIDSLRASMSARDERDARELNDRSHESAKEIDAARSPGWTPTSIAALAVLAQIAIVFLVTALQQKGDAWHDGQALYYALNSERWASGVGATLRASLGPGVLKGWTTALRASELAIPVLVFVPVAPRVTRGIATILVLFAGLTYGVLFSFGLFGWTLVASAALLVPIAAWESVEGHAIPARMRTVIYDADCGVCLVLARLLKRLDLRGNVTLQGNDDREGLWARSASGKLERRELPKEITAELVDSTVVVVDANGRVYTRARAIAEIIRVLPLGWLVAWAMALPGIVSLLNVLYDFVATRRQRISVAIGKGACGIDAPHADGEEAPAPEPFVAPPSTRIRRGGLALVRETCAAIVLAAALSQTAHANELPWSLPHPSWLAAVAAWPRMLAKWDVLAAIPTEDEVFVVDGQTRAGQSVDPFTGKEPEFNPGAMHGTGLGQLWNDYLYRIRQKEWFEYQRAFRDYLAKGGPAWDDMQGDNQLVGLDAYWLKQPIPKPGEAREAVLSGRERIFTQSRGGKLGMEKSLPLLNKH